MKLLGKRVVAAAGLAAAGLQKLTERKKANAKKEG